MTRIIDFAAPLGQKAGPGQWNDLDMRKHLPRATFRERSHAVIHSSDWVGVIVSAPPSVTLASLTPSQERWHDVR